MIELPPFPSIPQSPEERLRLTQYGELVLAMALAECVDELAAAVINGELPAICEDASDWLSRRFECAAKFPVKEK
jgi:hypothetical protein